METRFKVTVMPLAEEGLCNIQDCVFLQTKDPEIAERVIRRIVAYANTNLTFNPFMGRVISEYKFRTALDVRRITAEKWYNIYYHVDEQFQEVYIIKIVDGRRPIEQQLHGL